MEHLSVFLLGFKMNHITGLHCFPIEQEDRFCRIHLLHVPPTLSSGVAHEDTDRVEEVAEHVPASNLRLVQHQLHTAQRVHVQVTAPALQSTE